VACDTRVVAGVRPALAAVALSITLVASAHGGSAPSAAGLRTLLAGAHVPLSRGATQTVASFPAAWAAFQRFARLDNDPSDDVRYEFGVFESKFWGTSFEVALTRGHAGKQVHLVVHFPVAAYVAITRNLRATPCLPGAGCAFRCFFVGDDALVSHPCRVTSGGYRVGDMTLSGRRITPWAAAVESSPVFRGLLTRHVRPDGYEVWEG